MKQIFTVMLALCLTVGLSVLGCSNMDYGTGNCITQVDTSGDVSDVTGGCADEPLTPTGEVNLCSYPSGTDLPDETCRQNGGTHDCVPCSEVE